MKILRMPETIIRKRDRTSCTWSLLDTIQHSLLSLKGFVSNNSGESGGGGGAEAEAVAEVEAVAGGGGGGWRGQLWWW